MVDSTCSTYVHTRTLVYPCSHKFSHTQTQQKRVQGHPWTCWSVSKGHPITPFSPNLLPLEPNPRLSAVHGTGEGRSHQPMTPAVEVNGQGTIQTTGLPEHSLYPEEPLDTGDHAAGTPTEVSPVTLLPPNHPASTFPGVPQSRPLAPMCCPGHASAQGKATTLPPNVPS